MIATNVKGRLGLTKNLGCKRHPPCDRLRPCRAAINLWDKVADAYGLLASRQRDYDPLVDHVQYLYVQSNYDAALDRWEQHFTEVAAVQAPPML